MFFFANLFDDIAIVFKNVWTVYGDINAGPDVNLAISGDA